MINLRYIYNDKPVKCRGCSHHRQEGYMVVSSIMEPDSKPVFLCIDCLHKLFEKVRSYNEEGAEDF